MPDKPLFTRAYSAVGFFGHLEAAGIDPWTKLADVLDAKSNESAFKAAGAEGDPFLDSWASSYLRDPSRGAPWEVSGPGVPSGTNAKPTDIHLSNGGSVEAAAAAYANEIAVFADSPEVLVTAFSGHARLSDAAGHDYLVGNSGAFCMLDTGCVCPGSAGESPPLPLEGDEVALGVTGGPKGASGSLSGMKLDDFCSNLTGTWVGTWMNDPEWGGANGGFTLQMVQKGSKISGTIDLTGPTCNRHGTIDGTLSGKEITFGLVSTTRDTTFSGTVSGNSMSGTWGATACDVDLQISGTWAATKQ